MSSPRDSRYMHVTWLPGIIAGQKHCQWAAWFKTNYWFDKMPEGDMEGWNRHHTRMLTDTRKRLRSEGAKIILSEQEIKWKRETGMMIHGAADLVVIRDDGTGTVYDCKTGHAKQADIEQVMMYMYLLPLCNPRFKDITFSGEVIYEKRVVEIEAGRIDASWLSDFNYFLDLVDTDEPAEKVPGHYECL